MYIVQSILDKVEMNLNKFGINLAAAVTSAPSEGPCLDPGSRVIDGLYIGSLITGMSKSWLRDNHIGAVVNLSCVKYPPQVITQIITIGDTNVDQSNIHDYLFNFREGVKFVHAQRQAGKPILVHCHAGINRSATLIGMYLIVYEGMSAQEAINTLTLANHRRGLDVLTNPSFVRLLHAVDDAKGVYNRRNVHE